MLEHNDACKELLNRVLERPISILPLSVRAYNCLSYVGIEYIGQLIQWESADLLKIPSLGRGALEEIEYCLRNYLGLALGLNIQWSLQGGVVSADIRSSPPSSTEEPQIAQAVGRRPVDFAAPELFNLHVLRKTEDLDLSGRTSRRLLSEGLVYVAQLIQQNRDFYLDLEGFGQPSLVELETRLLMLGLGFGTDLPDDFIETIEQRRRSHTAELQILERLRASMDAMKGDTD